MWAQFFLPCKAGKPIDDPSAKPAPVNVEREKGRKKKRKKRKEKKGQNQTNASERESRSGRPGKC
jgi:hypothetical protein